jgi:hypothetical protein
MRLSSNIINPFDSTHEISRLETLSLTGWIYFVSEISTSQVPIGRQTDTTVTFTHYEYFTERVATCEQSKIQCYRIPHTNIQKHFMLRYYIITTTTTTTTVRSGMTQWYSAELRSRRSGVRIPAGAEKFSLYHLIQTGSGGHPASYPLDTMGSFPGVKRPGREADHSPPSNAEIKNAWSYTSTPPLSLHGVVFT